ncbi:MAG: hypothetical protein HOM21_07035 [Halobacteriovoraceae bacterium]|jgi:membrane-bound lytic murein transglycosylase A|nr:hypothetical protein [Halobacteriovoraceae bacterium]
MARSKSRKITLFLCYNSAMKNQKAIPTVLLAFLLLLTNLFSCARQEVTETAKAMRPAQTPPNLGDDLKLKSLIVGLKKSITRLKKSQKVLHFGEKEISSQAYAKELSKILNVFKKDPSQVLSYIKNTFEWQEVYGREEWGEILMTSYYEPIYEGRRSKTARFSQAIYQLPKDFVEVELDAFSREDLGNFDTDRKKVGGRVTSGPIGDKIIPYYNREEIDIAGKLNGKGLELYYLDPIQAFFLQIQGSGAVRLKNGSIHRVGYAGQNGFRYQSIGKKLFDIIPKSEMSLQRIEAHLRTLSKEDLYQFLKCNPSYVFFKKLKSGRGRTTFGPQVIPGRTIAVDPRFFALGSLAYLSFQKPVFENKYSTVPLKFETRDRFVVAHDTGGAIKGPGRADLFWGEGASALQYAGVLRHPAKLWFLFPKNW